LLVFSTSSILTTSFPVRNRRGPRLLLRGLLLLGSRRFGLQIDDQATATHSKPNRWKLQRHDRSHPENS
jgi:hypothetical protein